jgi:hypothetical protein
MENNINLVQVMLLDMLGNTGGYAAYRSLGHYAWLVLPALIRMAINITMITGDVAATVNLKHELTKRPHRRDGQRALWLRWLN